MIRSIHTLITGLAGAALVVAGLVASPAAGALSAQTITFNSIADQAYGTTLTLSATASSGLPVSFSSGTTGVCTVSGTTVSYAATGTCIIAANQAGNATYAAAPQKTQSYSVTAGTQTISFAALAGKSYGAAPFAVSATASSGLAVAFSSGTKSVCTVAGNGVTIAGVGTCTINANQAGNANYIAAPQVSQSFTVVQSTQSISFTAIKNIAYGATATLSASASSGMAVNFTSATPGICTVLGNSVTGVAPGTCTIDANEAGSTDTSAAAQVSQSFPVVQATQAISFAQNGGADVGMAVNLAATASSGLPVSFASLTPAICSVTGNTATGLAAGTCYVSANQAGNADISAAPQVNHYFSFTTPGSRVVLTSPTAGTTSGKNLTFSATAISNSGDSIVQVAFYNGTSLLGTVTKPPYTLTFPDFDPGTYSFTAQATEAIFGNVARSMPVVVTIAAEGASGATTTGAQTIYAVYADQLDTPRMITDQTGNVVWQWDNTEPFGNNLPNQDPNGTGSQYIFNFRYPGMYSDVETGTNYNYFRDCYDPATGRYCQSDPIGMYGGQPSTYAYVNGNPLIRIDPLGLAPDAIVYYNARADSGHHIFPQSLWRKDDIPNDAKDVFNRSTIKPAGRHGWNRAHVRYNRAVSDLFNSFCKSNKIDPSKMSVKNAKDFIDEVLKSTNPDIRDFLEAEQGPYIPNGKTTADIPIGSSESDINDVELQMRMNEWLLGGKPIEEVPELPWMIEVP